MGESRLVIGLCHVFGMQGSLVQIQSSRPSIFQRNQSVMLEHCTLIFLCTSSFGTLLAPFPSGADHLRFLDQIKLRPSIVEPHAVHGLEEFLIRNSDVAVRYGSFRGMPYNEVTHRRVYP
jgi:hypothetical protein